MTPKNEEKPLEFYRRFRPTCYEEVLGQDNAVAALTAWTDPKRMDLPHAVLLTGPSGTGKTTLARITAKRMGCEPTEANGDFYEVNCAEKSSRGIAAIEAMEEATHYMAAGSKCRVWILDEVHRLTSDAQASLLKLLEDGPSHCYFFFCTTDPHKLIDTLQSRLQTLALNPLAPEVVTAILEDVLDRTGVELASGVLDKIISTSRGNGRKAVQTLERIAQLDLEDQLDAVEPEGEEKHGIDLARALMDGSNKWVDIATLLKAMKGDAENIRRSCFGYAAAILRNGKQDKRAHLIMTTFDVTAIYDGMNQITKAAYEVFLTR